MPYKIIECQAKYIAFPFWLYEFRDLSIALFLVLCFRIVPTVVQKKVTVFLISIITNETHSCVTDMQQYHYQGRTSACPHIAQHLTEKPDVTNLLLYCYQTYASNIRYHVLSFYKIHLTHTYIKMFKCSNYFYIRHLFVTVCVHILSSESSDPLSVTKSRLLMVKKQSAILELQLAHKRNVIATKTCNQNKEKSFFFPLPVIIILYPLYAGHSNNL